MENPPIIWIEGIRVEPSKENVKHAFRGDTLFEVPTPKEDLLVLRRLEFREGFRQHVDLINAFDKQGRYVKLDRVPDEVYDAVPCPFYESKEGKPVRCGGAEHDVDNWREIASHEDR